MNTYYEKHLEVLKNIDHKQQKAVGIAVRKWILDIIPEEQLNSLETDAIPNGKISRGNIFDLSQNQDVGDFEISLCVLAWGGMRRDHGRSLIRTKQHWLPIVNAIRSGDIESRAKAYKKFMDVRSDGNLKGMGPAFFTKLICFLSRDFDAFIMDQWTGKSINLLLGNSLVKLTRTGMVNDDNNEIIYDQFCKQIEKLSEIIGSSPLETEERIFSEGRGRGEWRNYLIKNYKI